MRKLLEVWGKTPQGLKKSYQKEFSDNKSDSDILSSKELDFVSCYRNYKGMGIRMYRGKHPIFGHMIFVRITEVATHDKYLKNLKKQRDNGK